jgi:hypothetical protein
MMVLVKMVLKIRQLGSSLKKLQMGHRALGAKSVRIEMMTHLRQTAKMMTTLTNGEK